MAMAGQTHFTTSVNWSEIVEKMYPEMLTTTYSVPPVHFNRIPYSRQIVPGTGLPALVVQDPIVAGAALPTHDLTPDSLQPMPPPPPHNLWSVAPLRYLWRVARLLKKKPQKKRTKVHTSVGPTTVMQTDVQDDTAQVQVLRNLQEFGEHSKQAMFIISQLNFNEYLQEPQYGAAVAQLPAVPQDPMTGRQLEGDFDVIVIHRQCGILVGELKTVGMDPAFSTDVVVGKVIQKALNQLDKSKDVTEHLVSDVASSDRLTVRTTLFLPYVSREQLQRVLAANPQLEQAACSTLGAASAAEAAKLCCCKDQLAGPHQEVTPAVLLELGFWWQNRMCPQDPHLTDKRYVDVVARFVGPATSVTVHCTTGPRVQVKTLGQAVSELGRRLTTLVLTPEQVDIMQMSLWLRLVYLNGPPGTGKTVVLTLVGLRWLRQGKDVHVVSVWEGSRAASRLIVTQLETTLAADSTPPPGCGTVFLHEYDLDKDAEKDRAVRELAAFGHEVFVLCDEAAGLGPGLVRGPGLHPGPGLLNFPVLLTELSAQCSHLWLWAAGVRHTDTPPQMTPLPLRHALRSAPAVVELVQKQIAGPIWSRHIHPYKDTRFHAAGDGLRVERLTHEVRGHGAHTGRRLHDCYKCGQEVAAVLRRLDVPGPVRYRDVLLLSYSVTRLKNLVTDDVNNTTSADCRLVQAIQDAGLAVKVMDPGADSATRERQLDEIVGATEDTVVATGIDCVQGLERKVVVVVGDDPWLLLHGASRATTHLVIVS